jgi:hypothetical protein
MQQYLAICRFLLTFSKSVIQWLSEINFSIDCLSDSSFLISLFSMLKKECSYTPNITTQQFLSTTFPVLEKVIFINEFAAICIQKHNDYYRRRNNINRQGTENTQLQSVTSSTQPSGVLLNYSSQTGISSSSVSNSLNESNTQSANHYSRLLSSNIPSLNSTNDTQSQNGSTRLISSSLSAFSTPTNISSPTSTNPIITSSPLNSSSIGYQSSSSTLSSYTSNSSFSLPDSNHTITSSSSTCSSTSLTNPFHVSPSPLNSSKKLIYNSSSTDFEVESLKNELNETKKRFEVFLF